MAELGSPSPHPGPGSLRLVNGKDPKCTTRRFKALMSMSPVNLVPFRPNRKLAGGGKKPCRPEEAWVGTEVGDVEERPCDRCAGNLGPFVNCVTVPSYFGGACTNCHYSSMNSECSFVHWEQGYEAAAYAEENPAPEIPGMAPAIYYGGLLADLGQDPFAPAKTASATNIASSPLTVNTASIETRSGACSAPAETIARGGRGVRRITPTLVIVEAKAAGFGDTAEQALAYARALTPEQRARERKRIRRELMALEQADNETNDLKNSENETENRNDETV